MSKGQDHIGAAIAACEQITAGLSALGEHDWVAAADKRVSRAREAMEATVDRFFLRSRLCLPFAARCEEKATALAEAVANTSDTRATQVEDALIDLEKAVRTLDARSQMQDMSIT